jgi:hypothetical protein
MCLKSELQQAWTSMLDGIFGIKEKMIRNLTISSLLKTILRVIVRKSCVSDSASLSFFTAAAVSSFAD